MKIYNVKENTNVFQWVMPEIGDERLLDLTTFNCKSRINEWPDINWYISNPANEAGNFYTLGNSGALVFDEEVYNSDLRTSLEMGGEILPIKVVEKKLYILNVLICTNMLDERKTTFHHYPDGERGRILKYVFHENRLDESSLFKIPQTMRGQILTYSGIKNPTDEFYSVYHQLGFTGLIFEELYQT